MGQPLTLQKIALLLSCLWLSALAVNGQNPASTSLNPTLSTVLPPSPNVSALGKFGSIPVGQSTGIPQVGVPIYQYANKNSGLSLNVALSYHAGGVRVDEVASNVGLGWALSAGGAVSRVLRGLPDEWSVGFWHSPYFTATDGNDQAKDRPFLRATNGLVDLEADIFSYTFNGRSGKFTYGRNGQLLLLDDNKLRIENTVAAAPASAGGREFIASFTILDEQGTRYVFDATELTKPSTFPVSSYYSSWQLTSIQSATGRDQITFEYQGVSILPYTTSQSQTITGEIYPNSAAGNPSETSSTSSQTMTLDAKVLKKITLPNGVTVQFAYEATQRQDLPGDYLLHQITLRDAKDQLTRGFLLEQDYSLTQRATLLRVTPFSGLSAAVREPPYQFFYNAGLPARLSNRQDHWGYPIGYPLDVSDNRTLIPREIFGKNIGGRFELPGINRDTDPRTCMAGTLKRMQYPTGGYTDFDLEPNQAVDGWLSQNVPVLEPSSPTTRVENTYLSMYNNAPAYQDSYFTFNGTQTDYTEYTLSISPTSGPASTSSGVLRVEVFPTTGNTQEYVATLDFTYPFATASDGTRTFIIPSGAAPGAQYRMRFYYNAMGVQSLNTTQAQLRWTEDTHQPQVHTYSHVQPYVGGLRVKRILDYDGISADPVSVRQYTYEKEDGTSSGVLTSYPSYTHTVYYTSSLHFGTNNQDITRGYVPYDPLIYIRESSSAHDVVYTNGSPVTYSRVVETQLSATGPNGKTERLFSIASPRSRDNFPYVPQQSYDWEAGLLQQENTYDAKGTLLKKVQNTYAVKFLPDYNSAAEIQNYTSYTTAPVAFWRPEEYHGADEAMVVASFSPYWFLSNNYLPRGGRSDLTSSVTTTYDPAGLTAQREAVGYDYDPVYYYLKRKRYTDSQQRPITEEYAYAADKVGAGITSPYSAMVSRNILNPVLETSRTVNGTQLQATSTNYQAGLATNSDAILPGTVQSQFRTQAPETRLRYERYDDVGNPLSQGKEQDVRTCYVWGYNKQYPVAEIKNIDYATLEAVLGGAQAVADFGNIVYPEDNAVQSFLAVLRTDARLARAQVTTITYAPLTGPTSTTDPSGRRITYEYDGFGRLVRTRDEQGRILSQQQYHYAGQ
jgi:YD repeat-containing protein